MNNLYFLESDNKELLDLKISEILKENNLNYDNLIVYDMNDSNISKAILDLDTYSMFNERKVVFCKDATFLSSEKSEIDHDTKLFEKYLNNPNPENILIISCSKLDGKKNIAKLVKEKCQLFNMDLDINKFIEKKCSGYKISPDTINYFLLNTGSDLTRVMNELDKLLMYKIDNKEITKKDIDLIVIKKIDMNIFELIDAIISKNKKKSLAIYQEMINYGEDIFKIFVSLANQIRLIYQVKTLRNFSDNEICEMLKLKSIKQVMAIRYKIDKYTSSELLDYLYRLSIMDEELKMGKSIDKIVFPIFIANL